MDTAALLAEGKRLGLEALGDIVTSLDTTWDKLPAEIKDEVTRCVERLAQAKALRLAGISSTTVLTAADEKIMLSVLADVKVAGAITLQQLVVSTLDSVLMRALEMVGSLLRKTLGL